MVFLLHMKVTDLNLKRLSNLLPAVFNTIVSEVYPVQCLVCECRIDESKSPGFVCASCKEGLVGRDSFYCSRCKATLPDKTLIFADTCQLCSQLEGPVKGLISINRYHPSGSLARLILGLKHGKKTYISSALGQLVADKIQLTGYENDVDIVTSVPLHFTRFIKRGYNQADLIAQSCAKSLKKDYYSWILSRKRRTVPQSGSPEIRRENVRGAFRVKAFIRNASVLLIDDVFTTGSTTLECARCLLDAGANAVLIGTCAWVPLAHIQ